ncbi:MAG: hypothetical protein Q4B46_11010 [Comamonadaceae bacterium]|nr:hypothetical protein [Comamonadaceae bacterium]
MDEIVAPKQGWRTLWHASNADAQQKTAHNLCSACIPTLTSMQALAQVYAASAFAAQAFTGKKKPACAGLAGPI